MPAAFLVRCGAHSTLCTKEITNRIHGLACNALLKDRFTVSIQSWAVLYMLVQHQLASSDRMRPPASATTGRKGDAAAVTTGHHARAALGPAASASSPSLCRSKDLLGLTGGDSVGSRAATCLGGSKSSSESTTWRRRRLPGELPSASSGDGGTTSASSSAPASASSRDGAGPASSPSSPSSSSFSPRSGRT